MKKFKNIKLMLIGLFVLVGMNAFGAPIIKKYKNLVYEVADEAQKTVQFVGLNETLTLTGEDADNDDTKITVPATIAPLDAEGNPESWKVTSVKPYWYTADAGLTQGITNKLETLAFDAKIKLDAETVKNLFLPAFPGNHLKSLTIGDGRFVDKLGNGTDAVAFADYIQTINIAGITNDVDGDVEIAKGLFKGCAQLTSVSLPTKSPVIIGEDAFRLCTSLENFSFAGVKSIGANAFLSTIIKTVNIPSSVESIGADAFKAGAMGAKVTTVTIDAGEKLTTIPAVFGGQTDITTVGIKGAATGVAANAFADATKLATLDCTGASALNSFGAGCFASTKFVTVKLSDTQLKSVFPIDPSASAGTLVTFTFPPTLENALPSFNGCASLTTINDIPAGVTSIPDNGFKGAAKLDAITFAANSKLETIGSNAFNGCVKLATVTLNCPVLEKIGEKAFYHCEELGAIDLSGTICWSIGKAAFSMEYDDVKDEYKTKLTSVKFADMTGKKVKGSSGKYDKDATEMTIGDRAFLNCAALTIKPEDMNLNQELLNFPAESTRQFAFSGLSGELKLDKAFKKDKDGKYINFTSVPQYAFEATAITSVKLPEGIKEIQAKAFRDCEGLTTVNFADLQNLETLGVSCFEGCGLTSVDLSAIKTRKDKAYLFTEIPARAFALNKNLASVKMPYQISSIGAQAFCYDVKLASINLEETNISYLPNLFTEDSNSEEISIDALKSITLKKSDKKIIKDGTDDEEVDLEPLVVIDDYAFQFTGLNTKVVIPSSVEYMGVGVFQACLDLTEFEWTNVYGNVDGSGFYPAIVTLPYDTFRGDVKLAKVTFLATAKTSELEPIKDKEVFFMCNKSLTVILTPDHFKVTEASGYGNENRTYSTLDTEGNVQFAFSEKGLANDEFYYATYYNEVNASWFDATKFDVFSAVIQGSKVVLKPATADGGYYKVARYNGSNEAKAVCVVRSKDINAVPELKSNDGSEYLSTFGDSQLQVADGVYDRGSKLDYVFKLANVKGNVAFYRVTSGVFAEGKVFIKADPSAPARLDIVVEGEGAITGIENIFSAEEDNAPIFNLQGVQVKEAKNGMFIKNGKKYIVK